MPDFKYRIFFDHQNATSRELEGIEEITVEQEIGIAWEARLKVPIAVDARGNWTGDDENYMRSFSRVRVEIQCGTGVFRPLIDGPVTGFASRLSSNPGQSHLTVIVQDDTFFLNRVEQVAVFENQADHEIAGRVFQNFSELIATTCIEPTPSSGSSFPAWVVQRGTAMDLLRFLARRQGMHAYVLPGEDSGQSIGCFRKLPERTDGLLPVILLGDPRNIDSLDIEYCACKPAHFSASSMYLGDKQVIVDTARTSSQPSLGDEGEREHNLGTSERILPPEQGEEVNLSQALQAACERSGYAYEAKGNVISDNYTDILEPYRLIAVQAGNTPMSGDYLIREVIHTITRSQYSQSFKLMRNARSFRFGSSLAVPGGIF